MLLIDIRELVDQNSFTRELAHFIAHPERDKGLCYDDLNLRALVLNQQTPNKRVFTSPLDLFSIQKRVFDIITGVGINGLAKSKSLNKAEASKLRGIFMNDYELDKKTGSFNIKNQANFNTIVGVVDEILSVLRTYPIIEPAEMIRQLNGDIKKIFNKFNPALTYPDVILRNADDIVVCIFCLFQDSMFKIFDGSQGRFELSKYLDSELFKEEFLELKKGETMSVLLEEMKALQVRQIEESTLSLNGVFTIGAISMISCFIPSNLLVKNYVKGEVIKEYVSDLISRDLEGKKVSDFFLKNVQTKRDDDGKLWIVKVTA